MIAATDRDRNLGMDYYITDDPGCGGVIRSLPEDFKVESFQRLCVNAVHWCLNRKPKKWKGPLGIDVPYRGMVKS